MRDLRVKTWMIGLGLVLGLSTLANQSFAESAPANWWPTSNVSGNLDKSIGLLNSLELSFTQPIEVTSFATMTPLKKPLGGAECSLLIRRENPQAKAVIEAGRPSVGAPISDSKIYTSFGAWLDWTSVLGVSQDISGWILHLKDPNGKIQTLACNFPTQKAEEALKKIEKTLHANGITLKANYKADGIETIEKVARPTEDFVAVDPESVQAVH